MWNNQSVAIETLFYLTQICPDFCLNSARPGRPSKRTALPLYLQERMNFSTNSESSPSKIPRFELGFPSHLESLKTLLSLPPETVFEWFRLSCELSQIPIGFSCLHNNNNSKYVSLTGVGDKPYNFGQNFPMRTSIYRSTGENGLSYPTFENCSLTETDDLHVNESRLSKQRIILFSILHFF